MKGNNMLEQLQRIIEINRIILKDDTQILTPCLYGDSGVGKTTIVKELQKIYNMPIEVILLHSMLAEEFCGIPRYDSKTKKVVWSIPEWFDKDNPKIYFIDELDKVNKEELGVLLTLLADRTVRNIKLPNESIIICAMQPIEPSTWTETKTGQALIARLLFIPVENKVGIKYLENTYGVKLDFMPNNELKVPMLPYPKPRQLEYFFNFVNNSSIEEGKNILKYVINSDFMEALIRSYDESGFGLNRKKFIQRMNKNLDLVKKLPIYQLNSMIGEITEFGNSEVAIEAMLRIVEEGTFEDWENMLKNMYDYISMRIEESPDKVLDICNGDTIEHYQDVLNERLKQTEEIIKKKHDEYSKQNN